MDKRPSNLIDWLRLSHYRGISRRRKHAALERYPVPAAALAACTRGDTDSAELQAHIDRDLEWLNGDPCRRMLTLADDDYPPLLRQTDDPPLLLYLDGMSSALEPPLLAIVGSRNPTAAGRGQAASFSRAIAGAGIGIVSGLALGIDAAAHRGALDERHATLAVCATGLDQVYPRRHTKLADQIRANGLLISEFAIATPPRRDHFPKRNRIISGLTLGTLVVEAGLRSGSLITARAAVEQGREVFAVPGSIRSPQSRGCHALIKQGAKLVETVTDVLEEIAPHLASLVAAAPGRPGAPPTDPKQRKILEFLGFDPASIDELVHRSGLTADTVSSMLLQLEINGKVASCPGGRYVRT